MYTRSKVKRSKGSEGCITLKKKDLVVLVGVIGIIMMMILPIPTWLLDILLIINISLAMIILLIAMNTKEALEFSIFPAMLLITTLFRLALNISTTKLILGQADAGSVVSTFGSWIAGGQIAVGFIVFLILVVVQFIVITKGFGAGSGSRCSFYTRCDAW